MSLSQRPEAVGMVVGYYQFGPFCLTNIMVKNQLQLTVERRLPEESSHACISYSVQIN